MELIDRGNTHVASVKLQGKEAEGEDGHDKEVDSVWGRRAVC